MAEPLSAEERVAVCASGPLAIGEEYSQAAFIRYEVTCRALEAERDRLRAFVESVACQGRAAALAQEARELLAPRVPRRSRSDSGPKRTGRASGW